MKLLKQKRPRIDIKFVYFKAPESNDPWGGEGDSEQAAVAALVRLKILQICCGDNPDTRFYLEPLKQILSGDSELNIAKNPKLREALIAYLAPISNVGRQIEDLNIAADQSEQALDAYALILPDEAFINAFVHQLLANVEPDQSE